MNRGESLAFVGLVAAIAFGTVIYLGYTYSRSSLEHEIALTKAETTKVNQAALTHNFSNSKDGRESAVGSPLNISSGTASVNNASAIIAERGPQFQAGKDSYKYMIVKYAEQENKQFPNFTVMASSPLNNNNNSNKSSSVAAAPSSYNETAITTSSWSLNVQSEGPWQAVVTIQKANSTVGNMTNNNSPVLSGYGNTMKTISCEPDANYSIVLQALAPDSPTEPVHVTANVTKLVVASHQEPPQTLSSGVTDETFGLIYLIGEC